MRTRTRTRTATRGGSRNAARDAAREADQIESQIEQAEARLARVEALLASEGLYSDGERAREVVMEHREIMEELEKMYQAWETALGEAETTGGYED